MDDKKSSGAGKHIGVILILFAFFLLAYVINPQRVTELVDAFHHSATGQ